MDTKTPLTDREAERVRTVLEQRKGKGRKLKLRELRTFSPEDIAKQHSLNASEIARMAGRKDQTGG